MGDVLDALQARLRPSDGTLVITGSDLAAPFASYFATLTLSDVPAGGGTIASGPRQGERTLSIPGKVASLPLTSRPEVLEDLDVVVTATATIGATTLSGASLSVSSATLALTTPNGTLTLTLSGALGGTQVTTLELTGTASGASLSADDAVAVTTRADAGLVPQAVRGVCAALLAPMVVGRVTVSTGPSTTIGLSLPLGQPWPVLGVSRFEVEGATLTVNGTTGKAGYGFGATLAATLAITVDGSPTKVGVSLGFAGSVWTLGIAPPDEPVADLLEALGVLAGVPAGTVSPFVDRLDLDQIALTGVTVTFDLTLPDYFRSIALAVQAGWFDATFDLGLVLSPQAPYVALSLLLPENPDDPAHQGVSLDAVLTGLERALPSQWIGSELSFSSGVTVQGLSVGVSPSSFDVALVVSTTLGLEVAGVELQFSEFELAVSYDGSGVSSSLGGKATIGKGALTVGASMARNSDATWSFGIDVQQGVPADLGSLLGSLASALGLDLPIPPELSVKVQLKSASLTYDTGSKAFALHADVTATTTLLGRALALDAALDFGTSLQDATRAYTFAVTLPWKIGASDLYLSYAYDSAAAEDVLTGWWAGQAPVTIADVLEAFGAPAPDPLPKILDDVVPALDGVYFAFDFARTNLTLAAIATVDDEVTLYLLLEVGKQIGQVPPASGFDFVVGIGLAAADAKKPLTLLDLPGLGKHLPSVFGDVGLEAVCLVVATCAPPSGGYAFPDLPYYGSNPQNPFSLVNTAADHQIPLVAATSGETLLAAASLGLADLAGLPEPMPTLSKLLATAGPLAPSLLLEASLTYGGGNASVAFAVLLEDLTLALPMKDGSGTAKIQLSPSGFKFSASQNDVNAQIFGTLGFAMTKPAFSFLVFGDIEIDPNEIQGTLYLVLGTDGKQYVRVPGLDLGLAGIGFGIGVDPDQLDVTFSAEGTFLIPTESTKPDRFGVIAGIDPEGVPNLLALLITIDEFDFGVVCDVLEVSSGPVRDAAEWLDKAFSMSDTTLAWAEQAGEQLPDGQIVPQGFMFCSRFHVVVLDAWIDVTIDETTNSYSGKVQTTAFAIGPKGAQLALSGDSKPVVVDGETVLAGGGPSGSLQTSSPYVDLTAQVEVDGLKAMTLHLDVQQASIGFGLDLGLPSPLPHLSLAMSLTESPLQASGSGDVAIGTDVLKHIGLPHWLGKLLGHIGSVKLEASLTIGPSDFDLELEVRLELFGIGGHADVSLHTVPEKILDVIVKLIEKAAKDASHLGRVDRVSQTAAVTGVAFLATGAVLGPAPIGVPLLAGAAGAGLVSIFASTYTARRGLDRWGLVTIGVVVVLASGAVLALAAALGS